MYQRTRAGLAAAVVLPAAIVVVQVTRTTEASGAVASHAACPGDGDCCVDNGTPGCDDEYCCNTVCAADPYCCDVFWDGICANQAMEMCELCWGCLFCPYCGDPGTGDCCEANDSPSCTDMACCENVCIGNPFCCDVEWDQMCADLAVELCPELCQVLCPWDLDGDGTVAVADLLLVIADFGPCAGCPSDFDGDGLVNVVDLLALIANFGPCPGSPCIWDVNGDDVIDQSDLQQVLDNMGPCEGCAEDVNGDGMVNGQDAAAVATHFGPCP